MNEKQKTLFWSAVLVVCSAVALSQIWTLFSANTGRTISTEQVARVSRTEDSNPCSKIPIEKIKVGQRVQAHNPEVSNQVRSSWNEPEWNQWVKLSLVMLKKDGTELKITMLRPESWVLEQVRYHLAKKQGPNTQKVSLTNNTPKIPVPRLAEASKEKSFETQTLASNANGMSSRQAQDLVPLSPIRPVFRDLLLTSAYLNAKGSKHNLRVAGITIEMDLPELGAEGLAILSGIEPAPAIKPLADSNGGPVVTATFHHASVDVIDLVVGSSTTSSDTETIGTTSNHPFWSVDRQKFVPAGDLKIGEALKSSKDSSDQYQVISQKPRPGPIPVYNLEVHGEHVYYVGQNGLLVHNNCGDEIALGFQDLVKTKNTTGLVLKSFDLKTIKMWGGKRYRALSEFVRDVVPHTERFFGSTPDLFNDLRKFIDDSSYIHFNLDGIPLTASSQRSFLDLGKVDEFYTAAELYHVLRNYRKSKTTFYLGGREIDAELFFDSKLLKEIDSGSF